ncbi:MAG: Type 1 glutamine amidotransferase-like domain-containing protein [Actinomycetota bacterium]|nr:Type 1 glutamine amidotransferase-like domain-containing protein [Actinomycetota bacterium]
MSIGPLALVGGDELHPGNEPQDRLLVEAAQGGLAFVVTTAAARQHPEQAAENAQRWFGELGLAVEELPLTTRSRARSSELAARARAGRFFYLVGGDPGLVPKVLAGTPSWDAIVEAWGEGAALAGSSAGAMAFGAWTLIRDRMPGDERRRYQPALGLVTGIAVVPHFDTFGQRWVGPSLDAAPRDDVILLGVDERTAAVFVDGSWRVEGAGSVSVITRAHRDVFGSGEEIRGLPPAGHVGS